MGKKGAGGREHHLVRGSDREDAGDEDLEERAEALRAEREQARRGKRTDRLPEAVHRELDVEGLFRRAPVHGYRL